MLTYSIMDTSATSSTYMAGTGIKIAYKTADEEEIITRVALLFNIPSLLLYEKNRHKPVKFARWFLIKIFYSRGYTVTALGRMFNMDHSSVIYALRTVNHDIEHDSYVGERWEEVKDFMGATPYKPKYVKQGPVAL